MENSDYTNSFKVALEEEKHHDVSLPKVLMVSALGYALVAGVRFYLAFMSNSIGVRADAWHAIADLGAVLSALAAFYISSRKSERFPRGLYKIENLASLVIAGLIFWAGYKIIKEAFFHHGGHHLQNIPIAIVGLSLTALVVIYLAYHKIHAGRSTGSPSTIAAGYHSMVAVFASLVVIAGLFGSLFDKDLDNYAAGIATAFLVWAGIRIAVNSLKVLLEASLHRKDINQITDILNSAPGITGVVSVSGREAGRYKFIEIVIALRTRDLDHADYLCKKIRRRVMDEIKNTDRVDITYVPGSRSQLQIKTPRVPPWRRVHSPTAGASNQSVTPR